MNWLRSLWQRFRHPIQYIAFPVEKGREYSIKIIVTEADGTYLARYHRMDWDGELIT